MQSLEWKWILTSALMAASTVASAQNQILGQPTQVEDVLTFEAGLQLERHDNILLLDEGVNPAPVYGSSERGDTILSGRFGVRFDRDISLQRVTLSATLLPVKYFEFSNFDYLGYQGLANLDWAIGRPFFGTAGIRLNQTASSFADIQQSDKNLQRYNTVYLTGGMRFTPSWAAVLGFDRVTLDNSTTAQRASDYQFVSFEAGARYAPGTGTELEFVWRRTDGEYPNRQVVDSLGGVLAQTIDNGFTQDAFLVRLQYKPNEDSTIGGQVGLTQRNFDNLPQRDFSGPTAQINYDWRPGGRFFMGVDLIRNIQSEEILTASYVDVTQVNLRPTIRLTGKLTLNGLVSWSKRAYEGDPGFVNTTAQVREDDVTSVGARLDWQYSRNILFNVEMRRVERDSNYQGLDYVDNVFGIGGRLNF